jgi:hypothetical protein
MARTLQEAEDIIKLYEQDGAAKLFYSLNRKMNELADLLNKQSLARLDIADPKDKSFERLKIAWNEASGIAISVKTLGEIAGITNDEAKDTNSPKYRITTPESISDVLGNSAGQHS